MSSSRRPSALSKGPPRTHNSTPPSSVEPRKIHWSDTLEVVEGSQSQMTAREGYRTKLPQDIAELFESVRRDDQLETLAKNVGELLGLDNTEEVIYTAFYCSISPWWHDLHCNEWTKSKVPGWGSLCQSAGAWIVSAAEQRELLPKGPDQAGKWCRRVITQGKGAVTGASRRLERYVQLTSALETARDFHLEEGCGANVDTASNWWPH